MKKLLSALLRCSARNSGIAILIFSSSQIVMAQPKAPDKLFIVPQSLLGAIYERLGKEPYSEVAPLMQALAGVREMPPIDPAKAQADAEAKRKFQDEQANKKE